MSIPLRHKRRELDPWMSSSEAAAHCGLTQDTIRTAVQLRELTYRRETRRDGSERGRIYIRLSELERWFAARTIEERRLA